MRDFLRDFWRLVTDGLANMRNFLRDLWRLVTDGLANMRDFFRDLWRLVTEPTPFASRNRWDMVRLGCLVVVIAAPVVFVVWLFGVVK